MVISGNKKKAGQNIVRTVGISKLEKNQVAEPVDHSGPVKLTDSEIDLITSLARDVSVEQSVVCLGEGEALEWIIKGLTKGNSRRVYLINENDSGESGGTAPGEVVTDISKAQDTEEAAVTVIKEYTTSTEATRRVKEKIGLLWVNNIGSYPALMQAVQSWQPRLSSDARVAFYQYDSPDLTRVIKEQLGELGDYKFLKSIDNILVVAIDECVHHWLIDAREIGVCKLCGRKRNFKRIRTGVKERESPGRRTGRR